MKRLLMLALAATTLLVGCSKPTAPAEEPEAKPAEAKEVALNEDQVKLAGIETETVSLSANVGSVELPGVVSATSRGRAMITPPVAGRVTALQVSLGQAVSVGQVLATIESPELAQAWAAVGEARRGVESAAAQVREATAQAALGQAREGVAKQTLVRQKQFAEAGAFSQSAVQLAQNELNEAQSELLSGQKEQSTHAENFRRIESLFRDGIVSRLDLDNAKLELQQDEIRLARIRAKLDFAKQGYDRERRIAQQGLQNRREVQSAEGDARAAELDHERLKLALNAAKAQWISARKGLVNSESSYRALASSASATGGRTQLVAPIAGTVARLDLTLGQTIERTQTVAEVEDLTAVWVRASLPELAAANVAVGRTVRLKVVAYPKVEFRGVVQVVGNRVDAKTRTIPVDCLVSGANGRLKPEMFATVLLDGPESAQTISVPTTALVKQAGKPAVFVRAGKGFSIREVELGEPIGDRIVVRAGLKAGDQVVIRGSFVLNSEMKKSELKGE